MSIPLHRSTKRGPALTLWPGLGVLLLVLALLVPLAAPLSAQSSGVIGGRVVPAPAPAPFGQSRSLVDAATQIEALLARGQTAEALLAARRFMRLVTDSTGFGVTNALLTAAPAEGFGMYTPRANNIYRTDEPVYAYVEVFGFSMSPLADGANRLLFDVSFTLDSPDGRQLTDTMISMGEVMLDSFNQPIDGYFHLTYQVTGVTGPVSLRTLVVDRASGQRTEFRLPVEFLPPGAAAPGNK